MSLGMMSLHPYDVSMLWVNSLYMTASVLSQLLAQCSIPYCIADVHAPICNHNVGPASLGCVLVAMAALQAQEMQCR